MSLTEGMIGIIIVSGKSLGVGSGNKICTVELFTDFFDSVTDFSCL